ncbi:hypothetical protein F4803DRAFT_569003 [Xylaria telfairii]|nr:hypothetical protein F4803DRAFT_569003 [Xylaria telfairii]
MYIFKLLFPAMLALRVLAQATEPSDGGAIEAQTKPPPFVDGDSHDQQDLDSSDAVGKLIAADTDEEEPEFDLHDLSPVQRGRWRRHWCRRRPWHWRCRRPLPRPYCPYGSDAYCRRGKLRRDYVPYDVKSPWCRKGRGHKVVCYRRGKGGTIIIVPGGGYGSGYSGGYGSGYTGGYGSGYSGGYDEGDSGSDNGDSGDSDNGDSGDSGDTDSGDSGDTDSGDSGDTDSGDSGDADSGDSGDTDSGDSDDTDSGDSDD